jgi:hypothetical protein
MKHFIISACFASLAAMGCTSNETKKDETASVSDTATTTAANVEATPAAPAPVDSATMMKNWEAYSTPGDMHKLMASWNGTWEGETTMWQAPGAPPQTSKGTAVNKTVLGGRYQVGTHKGTMMGMPFEGMSTLAYDNARKVFINTWIDNMGTGLMKLEGPWNESTKTLTLSGKCVDPSSGTGQEMNIREVLRVIDDKSQVMEMYGPGPDGKEYKMMEIKMTKQ